MSPQQTLENVDGPSSDDTLTDTPSRIKPLAAPASSPSSPLSSYVGMALVIAITYATYPDNLIPDPHQPASIHHVWYHGWITAISTGLGVLPLVFVSDFNKFWVGISNGKTQNRKVIHIILDDLLGTSVALNSFQLHIISFTNQSIDTTLPRPNQPSPPV